MSPKEPKSKPLKTIKIPPGQLNKLTQDVEDLEAWYGPLLAEWHLLTPGQREATLEHSPLLARLAALTEPLRGA
jgi:hypothetical protein